MLEIVSILTASNWQCQKCFCPGLWSPLILRVSSTLELSCDSRVDYLSFGLTRGSEGIDESREGEKGGEGGEDRIC
jgi:hypothetical protein